MINGADGIDISWIWDTDFDILLGQNINNIVCSGKRAKELALRLKYCGINANVVVNEDIPEAVAKLKSYNEKYAIAIPNYTALVETQRRIGEIIHMDLKFISFYAGIKLNLYGE